jgi:uncharacterized protein (DUF1330 family)
MRKEKFLEVVGSRPRPGKEKEYLKWYHQHLADMFKFEGCKRVSLNKIYQPVGEKGPLSPTYVTVYEFDSKQAVADFYKNIMMPSAGGQLKDALLPDSVDVLWSGYYEPVATLEK